MCIVQCLFNVILRICRSQYANFLLEVKPRPVPVPAAAEQLEGQPQEQRQAQQEGLDVDVDVEGDSEVPEVPEPADFGNDLHSPDNFMKVTSAEATAVDVIDGGGTRISRLFQAQVIRRGSGPNRVVECPLWAVVQGKAGGGNHGLSQLCHLCRCAPPPRTTGSSSVALTLWDNCRGGSSASGATCGPLPLPPT